MLLDRSLKYATNARKFLIIYRHNIIFKDMFPKLIISVSLYNMLHYYFHGKMDLNLILKVSW